MRTLAPSVAKSSVCVALVSALVVAAAAGFSVPCFAADPLDWSNWRGPHQNGTSLEKGLVDKWDPKGGTGGNVLWKRDDLGTISTPIVMNGKLYTLCRVDPGKPTEGERVVCVDAASGEDVWQNRFNVYLSDVPDTRVAWSCVVGDPATGNIYALGVCGLFQCLDGETGKTLWSHSMHEEYGLLSTYGGRTNVPVVFEDLVIISAIVIGWGEMAKPAHRFLAFDKMTGEVVWFNGTALLPYDTTYSTPSVKVVDGRAQLIFGSGDGAVWGLEPRTGRRIWKYQLARRGLNVSPLVVGDHVYMSHGEENIDDTTMGAVVAIHAAADGPRSREGEKDLTKSGELWRIKEIVAGKASPVMIDDKLVIVDDRATLLTFDAKSGERVGRRVKLGTMQRSSPLYADGKLYVCTASGRWYTFRPDGDRFKNIHKMRLPSGEESHGSPIASHGRLYLPTTDAIYCLADKDKQPAASEAPEPPVEKEGTDTPAHLQIVPAETLINPGETVQFRGRLFNELGQKLDATPELTFSVDGPGEVSADGTYTAPADAQHVAILVTAKSGELTGQARVRVVPPLPWKFDFADKEVPVTWVGARYRHQVREMDGDPVMVKVTTIPKGTRSQAWMGHPDLSDYTIEADIRGALRNGKLPDIGLTAQRYTIDLRGAEQTIQIRSWVPVLRMAVTQPFSWKTDIWYRMKFRADLEEKDGKQTALLRGKVWPKDEPEPEEWTITATDPSPNLSGSPGLYGNAKDAELYLDNITVTPNQ